MVKDIERWYSKFYTYYGYHRYWFGVRAKQESWQLVGYVDYNFAGDLVKCFFAIEYLFTLARGPANWRSIS